MVSGSPVSIEENVKEDKSQGPSSFLKAESKPSCFTVWNALVSSLCRTGAACLRSALRLFERVQQMCPCESWTIRKAEHWRIGAFELWCWRSFLRVPWTTRPNQSILKEINPEYSLEGLKLKLQYCGHLMWKDNSLEKTLMLGETDGRRRGSDRGWDGWMASPVQ